MFRPILTLSLLLLPVTLALSAPGLGLPALQQANPAVVTLGQKLFFDRRLSADGSLSCASCHIPEQGFTQNNRPTPAGIDGQALRRNAPTLLNAGHLRWLFHDGRETSLETQVFSPLLSASEMANKSIGLALQRIAAIHDYQDQFEQHLGGLNMLTLGTALAAYERSLIAADTDFDRWYFAREPNAMSEDAMLGFAIFNRHGCSSCHLVERTHATFEDGQFHNTGIGYARSVQQRSALATIMPTGSPQTAGDQQLANPVSGDLGRFEVTGDLADRWRYRTPTLRNVSLTAPYMHDGSMRDLDTVIRYYMQGGFADPDQDDRLLPFTLNEAEVQQLIAFLETLTSPHVDKLINTAQELPVSED